MTYQKIAESIPLEKREKLSDKLLNFVLKSKKESKMPSSLATSILDQWRLGPLTTEKGLAVLLKAAVLLESEKTIAFLEQELQLVSVAKAIEEMK
ncbi:MAG: hypothetical protein JSW19_03065 [Candidatus Bathyarchaeota archaeon]|nr:MAG: hypothetical protein JSV75_06025 [Candidatus Bathyarchaeota archaeon]UCE57357.1 MAG: hypothetical protein JSW19_03065 [Candidatus Bathyarchaeota archaeon]